MKISLPDQYEAFVEAQLASGRFASASAVVAEALRLMEENAEIEAGRLAWLQEAYRIGIESGDPVEVDIEELLSEAHAERAAAGK